jgi:hypothetical protein
MDEKPPKDHFFDVPTGVIPTGSEARFQPVSRPKSDREQGAILTGNKAQKTRKKAWCLQTGLEQAFPVHFSGHFSCYPIGNPPRPNIPENTVSTLNEGS